MPNSPSSAKANSGLNLDQAFIHTTNVHTNIGQEVLVTTEDKLEICLIRHQNLLKNKNKWMTPFGVFLPLLTTLVAADFKKFLGVSAELWQAIFIVSFLVTSIWLIHSSILSFHLRTSGSISSVISELKKNSKDLNG